MREGPRRVSCTLTGIAYEIAIEARVLPGDGPVAQAFGPVQELVDDIGFARLLRIKYLFFREAVHLERLIRYVCPIPHAALGIETILRVLEIQRPDRDDRVLVRFYPAGFYIDDEHGAIVPARATRSNPYSSLPLGTRPAARPFRS
jgi:hypothetical protein